MRLCISLYQRGSDKSVTTKNGSRPTATDVAALFSLPQWGKVASRLRCTNWCSPTREVEMTDEVSPSQNYSSSTVSRGKTVPLLPQEKAPLRRKSCNAKAFSCYNKNGGRPTTTDVAALFSLPQWGKVASRLRCTNWCSPTREVEMTDEVSPSQNYSSSTVSRGKTVPLLPQEKAPLRRKSCNAKVFSCYNKNGRI